MRAPGKILCFYLAVATLILLSIINPPPVTCAADETNVKILNSKDTADVVESMVKLSDDRILFVDPDYTPIPDVAAWGIISSDGKTISEYRASLPDDQIIFFIRVNKKNEVIGVARPDTSNGPPGPMGLYKYDLTNNKWIRIFKYQGSFYRVDPTSFVFVEDGYIVAGSLKRTKYSDWKGFIAKFTKSGQLLWINVLSYEGYSRIEARVFRYNDEIYSFISGQVGSNGNPSLLELIKISPSNGSYTIVKGRENAYPFLLKDNSNLHETIGLISDYQVKIFLPSSNTWKTYQLKHKLYGKPYEGEALIDQYIFAYSDENKKVYQVTITPSSVTEEYLGYVHVGIGGKINAYRNNDYIVVSVSEHPDKFGVGHVLVYKPPTPLLRTVTVTSTATVVNTVTTTIVSTATQPGTTKWYTLTKTITSTYTVPYTYTTTATSISTVTRTITTTVATATFTSTITITVGSVSRDAWLFSATVLGAGFVVFLYGWRRSKQ